MEISKMGESKGKKVAYAIEKECCRDSLIEWCEEWGFTTEDFNRFLAAGTEGFDSQAESGADDEDSDRLREGDWMCGTCELIKGIREYGTKRKEEPFAEVALKIKIVAEIWKNGHFSGQTMYGSKPMNYCPECGRKIKESEKGWTK